VPDDTGSISFIITGDEEGDADFGTVKMVEWLQANDQVPGCVRCWRANQSITSWRCD
jgi:hypothetical protein